MAEHVDPPTHEPLEWTTHIEPREGPDNFLEKILQHVDEGKSFTSLGAPGVGKTYILAKIKERLEHNDERVVCLAPTHAAARFYRMAILSTILLENSL